MRIVVVGKNEKHCGEIAQLLNTCATAREVPAWPHPIDTGHYLQAPLGADVCAAFVLVNTMADVQAARSIARLNPHTKLVIVSQSPEFGVEGFRIQATDYLLEPLCREDVEKALERCFAQEDAT